MDSKPKASNRPIVLATAALTVAVGLTVASLGGYLRRPAAPEPASTVLVPVTPEPAAAPPPAEPMFASYAPHEEREHGRHHGEHEHGHDDD